ncbi:RHS repeat-associated core domain-containing protein [Desulfonema ishimotonii]|uniref:RHS repeat-associated core domain-containing protein n=1 Tax=Desulfonema ishimotonii TaxID=45657 RepID=UPI003F75818B
MYDGSDNLLMRFEYADGRMPVAMTKGGQRYYLAYDQVGSLRAVTDASGNLVKRVEYDTFGNVISDSNTAFAVPFGFAGGLYDADTGLVRFGYRDYDPDTGRWTAKDPILFAGGDTDLYGYCLNEPVNLTDPNGLEIDWEKFFKYTNTVSRHSTKFLNRMEKIEIFVTKKIAKKFGLPVGTIVTKIGPIAGGALGAAVYILVNSSETGGDLLVMPDGRIYHMDEIGYYDNSKTTSCSK